METSKELIRRSVFALLGLCLVHAAHAQVFVSQGSAGRIGKYNLDGTPVNASLISGLSGPRGMAIYGTNLFVANLGNGTIGEYTIAGGTVNASLISGLSSLYGVVVVAPVPEPATSAMLSASLGLLILGFARRRRALA